MEERRTYGRVVAIKVVAIAERWVGEERKMFWETYKKKLNMGWAGLYTTVKFNSLVLFLFRLC